MDKINLEIEINANSERIYNDWLSSEGHSKMTGGEAVCSDRINDSFTAWDEYISGYNTELVKNERILQRWRTVEFPDEAEDSILEINLIKTGENKTLLKLKHTNLQIGDGKKYEDGWKMHYFEPMTEFYR